MPLDDGGEGTTAFSVIRLPNDAMLEGRVQVLSQDTPDVVWQRSVTADANGASMLSGILICADDPAEAAGRYERFTGKKRRVSGDGFRIALDRGEIAICNQEDCVALEILVSKYRIFRLSPPYPSSAAISLERDPTWMRTIFRWSLIRPIASSSMRLQGWGRISSFMQRKWSRFRNRERCLGVWIRFAYLASIFPFVERRTATISGWTRRFWQGSTDHRGGSRSTGKGRYPNRGSGCCLLGRSLSRRGRQT